MRCVLQYTFDIQRSLYYVLCYNNFRNIHILQVDTCPMNLVFLQNLPRVLARDTHTSLLAPQHRLFKVTSCQYESRVVMMILKAPRDIPSSPLCQV